MLSTYSYSAVKQEPVLKTVSSTEFYKLFLAEKGRTNTVILDVRTPDEFSAEHLEGAVNFNFYTADFKNQLNQLNKTKKYLIYCRTGNRSGKTFTIMTELGFKEVYNMSGGISEWKINQYPVVKQ